VFATIASMAFTTNGLAETGVMSVSSGDVDYAMSFNGTSQYATAPDNSGFDITGAITVEAWVKPTNTCSTCQVAVMMA
jgi:hypothetical protein